MQDEATMSFRLSPQQELFWLAQPEGPTDAGQVVLALVGPVDADRLRSALSTVIARHEILRSTFQRRAGMRTPLQVVLPDAAPDWQVVDVIGLGPDDQQARVVEIAGAERGRSWDYEGGPLLSARLLALAEDSFVLVLTVAAPCIDGGSLGTLAAELTALYGGAAVAEQPLQYADFAEWQNQIAFSDDEDAEAGRQFWSELGGATLATVPFLRRVAPSVTTTVEVQLPASDLESVARAHGASITSLLQAAWAVVLGKLGGDEELLVASAPARRLHAELETAVGAFVRPLPIRMRVSSDLTAGELGMQLVRAEEVAERWQDWAPLEDAAAGAGFVEAARFDPISTGELTVSCLAIAPPALFPLAVEWDGVDCRLRFAPDAIDADSAERIARYLAHVLATIGSAPEKKLDELDLLDADDVRRLTVTVNDTAMAFPQDAVHQLVAASATGDAAAVVDEGGSLSHEDLERRANQLAHWLRRAGVGPDSVVGLCTDRSRDMVVGLLGILKAGGAYLPLNFEHPPARLAHQLRETNAVAIVTQQAYLAHLPEHEGAVVCLDRDQASLEGEAVSAPDVEVTPGNLAYVMYTSGSTGTPKGVGVTHGNLSNYVHAISRRLGADKERLAFGMVTAISTDLGNTAVFPALCTGGTLVLVSPAAAADSAAAAAYLRANPVDVLKITPSHLNALLVGADGRDVLPKRWLVVGGEALSWDIVARVRELAACRILNHYGPTETTIGSCIFPVDDAAAASLSATVPIGGPIANSACYVLDEHGACVPEGVPGELHIAGAGVARGYEGRADLTDERFVPDPFAGADARMYATGDLVRRLPDGTIEFLGRRDDQVKIRGFRVEPAEIEAGLRAHSDVEEAVVVASADARGDHRLVGYVVVAKDVAPDALRRHLSEWVPDYMIPAAFVTLDSLPRTSSGKVDRLSLPSPESFSQAPAGAAFVEPRTPVEQAVAAIWGDVLGLERVGVDDDFFALGGHSLLATQIIAQIRSDFSIDLPLHALFESPTVATLSQQVVELMEEAPGGSTESLLAELEGLSEEEVARLLADDQPAESSPQ